MTLDHHIPLCLVILALAVCPAGAQPLGPQPDGRSPFEPRQKPAAQTRVYRLKHAEAAVITNVLKQIFGRDKPTVVADPRTNSILVHESAQMLAEIDTIVQILDVPQEARAAADTGGTVGGAPGALTANQQQRQPSPEEFIQMLRGGGSSRRGGSFAGEDLSATKVQSLRSDYEGLDRKAAELAEDFGLENIAPNSRRKPEDARRELRSVVAAAFGARQELQRAELALLRQRMTQIEQSIAAREQLKDKIVDQRVQELLNADLRWDPEAGGGSDALHSERRGLSPLSGVPTAEGSEPGASSSRFPAGRTGLPSGKPGSDYSAASTRTGADRAPAAAPQGLPWPSTAPSGTVILRSADEFTRKLQAAETELQHVQNRFKRRAAEQKDLDYANRHLESLRDEYKAQLRLLQLELDTAKSALAAETRLLNRYAALNAVGAVGGTEAELDRRKIAEGQARLRVQQLETLYELYRKVGEPTKDGPGERGSSAAEPSQPSPSPGGQPPSSSAPKPVGAAADPQAATPHEQTVNNLKALLLALHEYHDQHARLPPAVILGKDGKGTVPHSWRVELLPRLGQQALYDQYRFDEPWDSAHNKQLLSKMPDVFRSPRDASNSTHASYFGIVWPTHARLLPGGGDAASEGQIGAQGVVPAYSTVFSRPNGARMLEIHDGTSNTIALVEAKRTIPWTEPRDIAFFPSPDQQLPPLGGWFPEGFHAGFADGTVQFLSSANDPATLRALITIAGAEPAKPKLVDEPVR